MTKKRPLVPEDLLRLHFVSDPQVSPDGGRLLFSKKHIGEKNDYVANLWVVPAKGGEPRPFTAGGKDGNGRWSPDGGRVAFLSGRDEGRPQVYVMSADGGEAAALTRFPEGKVGTFQWSPDGTKLAVAFRETEAGWTSDDRRQREQTGASPPPRAIEDIYYRHDGDGWFNDRRFQLYVVDVSTGGHRLLFDRDATNSFHFDWSPDSSELVVSANTGRDALLKSWKVDLYRVRVKSGKAKKVPDLPAGVKAEVLWSPDGTRIAYVGREGKEQWGVNNSRLFVCDADGGGVRDLTGHQDYCLSATTISDTADSVFAANLAWSPDGKHIFLNFGWQGETHVSSIAVDGGDVVFHTSGRQTVTMGNLSRDGRRIALTVADVMNPAEVAVGELAEPGETRDNRAEAPPPDNRAETSPPLHKGGAGGVIQGPLERSTPPGPPLVRGGATAAFGRVADVAASDLDICPLTTFNRPLLDELALADAEPHWIDSTGGTRVQAWVMKPVGFKRGRKHPAVLEIHGGPHTQYGETFFHEFQVLAAAGYVVVFSNPRGSKGYGEAHCKAIQGNWGTADWDDIRAVTAFMKGVPYVKSKRMGVMGGSYGGYMTNWTIGHTNEFAAAITDRCVANLVSMAGTCDLPLVPGGYWPDNAWDDAGPLWEQSPLKYLGNAETPTLVLHSEGDLRCSIEQGEQVFAALKQRGVPTRFVRYPPNASHGLSRNGPPDLRLHRLGEILDWWRRYLTSPAAGK